MNKDFSEEMAGRVEQVQAIIEKYLPKKEQ